MWVRKTPKQGGLARVAALPPLCCVQATTPPPFPHLARAAARVDRQLRRHAQRVAELRLAGAELAVHLGDALGLGEAFLVLVFEWGF